MNYFARRLVYLVVVVSLVIFVVTTMFQFFPGNPAVAVIGDNATPAQIKAVDQSLHLNEGPIPRYFDWMRHAVTGDFGTSFRSGVPTMTTISQRLPVTLELVILAQIVALLYALATALYSAYKPGGLVDRVSSALSFALLSTPPFVLGIVVVLYISVQLGWFPVAGFVPLFVNPWENFRTIAMPALVLAAEPAAIYQRLLRGDAERTLREDYITMAYSKGISSRDVLLRHALRPSLFSTVTLAGLTTARLMGGAIVVESIFALPGIGSWLVDSIRSSDFPSVQAAVVIFAIFYVVINTLVDLSYRLLDPRTKAAR